MEQVILQAVGALSIIGLLSFGIVRFISYIRTIRWSNPFERYVRNIVLNYLRELSKDEDDNV